MKSKRISACQLLRALLLLLWLSLPGVSETFRNFSKDTERVKSSSWTRYPHLLPPL